MQCAGEKPASFERPARQPAPASLAAITCLRKSREWALNHKSLQKGIPSDSTCPQIGLANAPPAEPIAAHKATCIDVKQGRQARRKRTRPALTAQGSMRTSRTARIILYFSAPAASRILTILSGPATCPFAALSPFLILSTTSMPEVTSPTTVYCLFRNGASAKQMKN